MSEVIEQSLDVLTPMVGRCAQMLRPPQRGDGGGAGAPECHMDAVREACGAPGVQDDLCTDACLGIMKRTWDACTDGQGTGDDQFADYSDKIDACDDKSQDDGCDKSAAEILQWVATSCCDEDDGDCDGLPKDCNPECAGTFMPFFSRCGKTVFGADKDQLASMEHFNRQCAKASGRQHVIVEPLQPGGGADTGDVGDGGHAQLSGPDPSDPCSKIVSCDDCGGKEGHVGQKCGWCRAEIASKQLLHRTHGGWCSSECVSTSGECSAFQGHTRGQGRGGTDGSAGGRGGGH